MTPEERRKAAVKALNDPAIVEIIEELERDAYRNWAASPLPDRESREISYFQHLGATMLRETLNNWSRATERKGDK